MPKRMSSSQRERFLGGRHIAVLVTVGADGETVPTPIWYRFRDGAFYFRTAAGAVKTENARREPRVSVCVQDERPPYRAVVAHGLATIEAGHEELATEIPRHYLGAVGAIGYQRTARATIEEAGPSVTIVVRPERWTTFDFSEDTPLVGRLWLVLRRVLPPWL